MLTKSKSEGDIIIQFALLTRNRAGLFLLRDDLRVGGMAVFCFDGGDMVVTGGATRGTEGKLILF